ncbi:hypothetical protein quinque_003209 [Culex quinquefasciatus]
MSEKNSVTASLFVLTLILEVCSATWSTTPGPYYQRFNDGSYNYGYSAGGGFSARQSGTAANEVSGQFSQLLPDGKLVNVRYNAGVGGFRPQVGGGVSTTARPYGFSYNTGDAFHQAAADQSGNVRGNYWYRDPTGGRHDLRYRAGPGIGFVPTGGSLAVPNGLGRRSPFGGTTPRWNDPSVNAFGEDRLAYADPEASSVGGIHDPNGANSRSPAPTAGTIHHGDGPATDDRSYNFGYRTPDSVRQEGSDGRGNVHGSYAFRNGGGNHDLAYIAGPGIGFQPTGGTLARPNGLGYGGSAYGNDGGRVGSGVTRPALGSSGGINNAGVNGHSGLGHNGVGHLDPSYNGDGLGNEYQLTLDWQVQREAIEVWEDQDVKGSIMMAPTQILGQDQALIAQGPVAIPTEHPMEDRLVVQVLSEVVAVEAVVSTEVDILQGYPLIHSNLRDLDFRVVDLAVLRVLAEQL